jgi:hypothetical protein
MGTIVLEAMLMQTADGPPADTSLADVLETAYFVLANSDQDGAAARADTLSLWPRAGNEYATLTQTPAATLTGTRTTTMLRRLVVVMLHG